MTTQFVHLNVRTEYSMRDSIVRIKELMAAVKSDGQMAVAICDNHNFFAAIKFYEAAIRLGIKPILGVRLEIAAHPINQTICCYCMDLLGYQRLTALISRAYLEGQAEGKPQIKRDWLTAEALQSVLVVIDGMQPYLSDLLQSEQKNPIQNEMAFWRERLQDRFYIGISCYDEQEATQQLIQKILMLAIDQAVPVVAHHAVCFLNQNDFSAFKTRLCIYDGTVLSASNETKEFNENQYLKTQEEILALFADIPTVCENTVEVAKRCNLSLQLGEAYLPDFPVPDQNSIEGYLKALSEQGLKARLSDLAKQEEKTIDLYKARLQLELDVINSMGFAGYFLVVADFIQWAKSQGIPVGPGRGSGAGSLVAYALNITDLDPLEYNLLFERFLNPERVSMPDFDIDFCMERRDEVIAYVAEKYGRGAVSQIITFGSMAAKAVIRDVGRVLGHPYGFVDKIAKLIPFEIGMTLAKAMEQEPELKRRYDTEEEVKALLDLAMKLEGLARNVGKHAGGVVIAPNQLTDFSPLYCEANGDNLVTQFDKDDVERVGLVKFDFLGLRTLTIIEWACENIHQHHQKHIEISKISMEDKKTFDLLKQCLTTAVFQLESRGMKELIHRLQPDCFEDIIALVALFRPGPLQSGMVDDFINRKKGLAKIEYPHPDLEPILKPTYGVILYQEQVMQIAQVLAGYSLGAADLLRRAMGKKKPEEMAKQRDIFVSGAKARGVLEETAASIFDLMEKFAGYGFNKSHSAAYALLAYQTAWLKANYPACFMAAVLSSDMEHTDKVVQLLEDLKNLNIKVVPPDVNTSLYRFDVKSDNEILYGLGAIKGVGEAVTETIIQERKSHSAFKDYFDFFIRMHASKFNKRTLEALIDSGSLDSLLDNRAQLLANSDLALQYAQRLAASEEMGQTDFFSNETHDQSYVLETVDEWPLEEKLRREKATLGFYLSGHPFQTYASEISDMLTAKLACLPRDRTVTVAGFISKIRLLTTKRGKRLAIVHLEDGESQADVTVFSELFDEKRDHFVTDQLLIVRGETKWDDYSQSIRLVANELYSLDELRKKYLKCIHIHLQKDGDFSDQLLSLKKMLSEGGQTPIRLFYYSDNLKCELQSDRVWTIHFNEASDHQLNTIFHKKQLHYQYK